MSVHSGTMRTMRCTLLLRSDGHTAMFFETGNRSVPTSMYRELKISDMYFLLNYLLVSMCFDMEVSTMKCPRCVHCVLHFCNCASLYRMIRSSQMSKLLFQCIWSAMFVQHKLTVTSVIFIDVVL